MELTTQSALLQSAIEKQIGSVANNPALSAALQQTIGAGQTTNDGSGFKAVLNNAIQEVTESQKTAENLSRKALVGEASLNELVPAILSAETTLRTVTSIRDKVVESYREIMRTPI